MATFSKADETDKSDNINVSIIYNRVTLDQLRSLTLI